MELNKDCYLFNGTAKPIRWGGALSGPKSPPGIDCDLLDAFKKSFPDAAPAVADNAVMYGPAEPQESGFHIKRVCFGNTPGPLIHGASSLSLLATDVSAFV